MTRRFWSLGTGSVAFKTFVERLQHAVLDPTFAILASIDGIGSMFMICGFTSRVAATGRDIDVTFRLASLVQGRRIVQVRLAFGPGDSAVLTGGSGDVAEWLNAVGSA